MTKLVFLDVETTGLDLDRHEVWEVGAIVRTQVYDGNTITGWTEKEYHWFLPVDRSRADLIALNIGKFFDRYPSFTDRTPRDISDPLTFANEFMRLTVGAHLVGACVDFDAYRIARILRINGCIEAWNYHLVDVENLLAGKLCIPPPWKWRDTLTTVGIDMEKYEQHTALGDARLARDVYDWVMTSQVETPETI